MINVPFWSVAGFCWITERITDVVSNVANLKPAWISVPMFFMGSVGFFRKNSKAAWLFVLPLVVAFCAGGAAGRYVLGGRYSLFMVPAVLLSVGAMFDFFTERFGKKGLAATAMCAVIFLSGLVPLTWQHFLKSRQKEETRDFARFVQANFKKGDALMVNGMGHMAMWYYFGQNGAFQIPLNYLLSDEAYGDGKDEYIIIARTQIDFDENGIFDGFPGELKKRRVSINRDIDFKGAKRIWFFGGHMKGVEYFVSEHFEKRGIAPTLYFEKSGAALMLFEGRS
jgi:hypothetical protein